MCLRGTMEYFNTVKNTTDFLASVRLDIWLDITCLFRTRSEAKRACESGKVYVNQQRAKPHRLICHGDEVQIKRPFGRLQILRILGVAEQHLKKSDAKALYDDCTPEPTLEEIEMRRLDRLSGASVVGVADRRGRRQVRRWKEGR